ncbi:MAG: hypothetical protein ACTSQI_08350 [Candidatus Helarchaeota archaeon]
MEIILRGPMAHIILQECVDVSEIIQDTMLRPPEKYSLELHLDKNSKLISLIVSNIGSSFENLMKILNFFAKKYSKLQGPKFQSLYHSFLELIKELRKKKLLYPRNLFRFDFE